MDEVEWHFINNYSIKLMKEGSNYELWRIWWSICITRIKREIK